MTKEKINYTEEDYWEMYKERNGIETNDTGDHFAMRHTFVAFDELEQIFSSESIITCKFCKSKRITYTTAQFRSSDEAETVLRECQDCKKRFRIN